MLNELIYSAIALDTNQYDRILQSILTQSHTHR